MHFLKGPYIPHVLTSALLVSSKSDPEGCTMYMRIRTASVSFYAFYHHYLPVHTAQILRHLNQF